MRKIHTWFIVHAGKIEVFCFLANLIGLPIFVFLAWWFGWMSPAGTDSGYAECGNGPLKWDC